MVSEEVYCKEHGIRLSGRSLWRKTQEQKETETEQMYRDSCQRNWVEGKNGLLKTRYGMRRVMCKLDESAKSDLVFAILAMNTFRKLMENISYPFRKIGFSPLVYCLIQCCETAWIGKAGFFSRPYLESTEKERE